MKKMIFTAFIVGILAGQAHANVILWYVASTVQKTKARDAMSIWETADECNAAIAYTEKNHFSGPRSFDGIPLKTEKLGPGYFKTSSPDGRWVKEKFVCLPDNLKPNYIN